MGIGVPAKSASRRASSEGTRLEAELALEHERQAIAVKERGPVHELEVQMRPVVLPEFPSFPMTWPGRTR